MGRIRGKRNRDNDRYTAELRDRAQAGMVGAEPISFDEQGAILQLVSLAEDPIPLIKPDEPPAFDLPRLVRKIVADRPPTWQPPAPRVRDAIFPRFHDHLQGEATKAAGPEPQARHVGTNTSAGDLLPDPRGGLRQVVAVCNADDLRSRSSFWLWNPERAFSWLYDGFTARASYPRWRDRQLTRYGRIMLEGLL